MLGAEVVCGIEAGFDWWAKVSRSAAHLVDMFMSMGCYTRPASAAIAAHAAGRANDAGHAAYARDLAAAGAPRVANLLQRPSMGKAVIPISVLIYPLLIGRN